MDLELPLSEFPRETVDGWLHDSEGGKYAKLAYKKVMFEGGHGTLQLCERTDVSGNVAEILVKKPHNYMYVGTEAILQYIARRVLKTHKLHRSIPKVYDIFTGGNGRETRFSMEFIRGDFPYVFFEKVANPDIFFFQLLAQICVLLYFLEKDLYLDHRDLKANNLYVRDEPFDSIVEIENVKYHVTAPFHAVILDFGFACIGDESGVTRINVGTDVFPMTDPCPKKGRDLFHLVTSFCSIPSVYNKMSETTRNELDGWLTNGPNNFSKVAQRFKDSQWVYVVTSHPDFNYPKLNPLAILERLVKLAIIKTV